VLHPKLAEASHYFVDLPRFETVLCEFPRVDIVITSSWRHTRPLDILRAYFSADLHARIIGVTPDIPPAAGANDHGTRQAEVMSWLLVHGDADRPWVALDDEPHLYAAGAPVVVTSGGFGAAEEKRLRAALLNPSRYAQLCQMRDW
jgi:hypothetical protein